MLGARDSTYVSLAPNVKIKQIRFQPYMELLEEKYIYQINSPNIKITSAMSATEEWYIML